ncbi:hypothetical protein BDV40DRAFT_295227 [Aspergillus tamarii]|uniref:Uncharacterized protein n=1 Tax=Aspergillus tamarii TaxID=41984 RepID=A0A5N6V9U9_ASPTM|nr:hypothetical protein BDV40DRAFT_295227 [Aspergillus tamarii]
MYLGFWNSNYQYALSADTPMISTCLGDMVSIPLWVIVYSIADSVPYTLYAGEFSYFQEQERGRATSPKEILPNRSSLGQFNHSVKATVPLQLPSNPSNIVKFQAETDVMVRQVTLDIAERIATAQAPRLNRYFQLQEYLTTIYGVYAPQT